jgi:hypothetical protein
LFFFFKVILADLGPLPFHINVRIVLPISAKKEKKKTNWNYASQFLLDNLGLFIWNPSEDDSGFLTLSCYSISSNNHQAH